MKDAFDVMTDVRSLINVPAFSSLITGGIWPNNRPNNSTKIDVVVGVASVSNTQIQRAYGNVNIYVPTISTPDGKGGQQQTPDYAKMNALCKAAIPLLDVQYKQTFELEVDQAGSIFQDTDGSWFINIPYNYRSYNKEFNNY